MATNNAYVIGVDYGSDSVRTIIVDAQNGKELAASVFYYPRWKKQLYCDAIENQFRQHPLDYVEGLEFTIKECVTKVGADITANIKAISSLVILIFPINQLACAAPEIILSTTRVQNIGVISAIDAIAIKRSPNLVITVTAINVITRNPCDVVIGEEH